MTEHLPIGRNSPILQGPPMIIRGNISSRQVLGVTDHRDLDRKTDMDTSLQPQRDGLSQKRISYQEAQRSLT